MRSLRRFASYSLATAFILTFGGLTSSGSARSDSPSGVQADSCPSRDSRLTLPAGFCATVFADAIGHARHLVVSPDGVIYVNTWSGSYYHHDTPPAGGFLVALKDTHGTGKADVIERFGETVQSGGAGGTGIGLYRGALFAEINDKIVRYPLASGSILPTGPAQVIVSGLPLGGDHPMHPFVIDSAGMLYVDVGTATNACQSKNRSPKSPGITPCVELETRGGVWRFDANKLGQTFSPAERYASGIRNAEGFAIEPDGHILVTQHGRDQLHSNWPAVYQPDQEATLPAEELLDLVRAGDYGWPQCYYDAGLKQLVLAPEYGGNGHEAGICASKGGPIAAFPAHWAPNAMARYDQQAFPARYRNGVFIAFHGSWNRAPYPQGGYNVVFQPLAEDRGSGRCEVFADGFAGAIKSPDGAAHRPSGLAVGPDGALYVSDDIRGRIYRIDYRGGSGASAEAGGAPCPSLSAPAGQIASASALPPEGIHANAGAAANLPVPPGATHQMVALGDRIYHGQLAGAGCVGCHGANGTGGALGPDLTSSHRLWSDGTVAGIAATITNGVAQPKQYREPMPPLGGAQLSPSQIKAVAAYVWALSH